MKHTKSVLQKVKRHVANHWTSPMEQDVLEELIITLCNETDTPFGLSVITCLRHKNYNELLTLSIDPLQYEFSVSDYRADAQILGLIKKYPFWTLSTDPKIEAMKKFIAAEHQCLQTNLNISGGSLKKDPFVAGVLHRSQRIISEILGDLPSVDELQFKYGPGVNLSVKRNTSVYDKLNSSLEVTETCAHVAVDFIATCPGITAPVLNSARGSFLENTAVRLKPRHLLLTKSGKLTFVDKTALVLRPIEIVGSTQSVIQRGYGLWMKDRLKPYIDLGRTQDLHKSLVKIFSKTCKGATMDLVSASDCISTALILDQFPFEWYNALEACRSSSYEIDGNHYDYHKFSAMGNGYTFELETILFYAISRATSEVLGFSSESVSVYGDDIIIATPVFEHLKTVLELCGFQVNTSKSFSTGYFRESCGGDYLHGFDVRPFNLKDYVSLRTLTLMHNFFVRKGLTYVFQKTYAKIRKLISKPVCALLRGSDAVNGDGFLLDFQCVTPPTYFVEEKTQKRTLPKYKSFDLLKTYALYRQMYPSFDEPLANIFGQIFGKPGDSYKRSPHDVMLWANALRETQNNGFYLGVTETPLLIATKNPVFRVRSLAGREHLYSAFGCVAGSDLLGNIKDSALLPLTRRFIS